MTGESTEQILREAPNPETPDAVDEGSFDDVPGAPPPAPVEELPPVSPIEEMAVIDPEGAIPDTVTLENGTVLRLKDLRTRELFALLRIVTRGATPIMGDLNLDPSQGLQAFTSQLIALLVFAVPEADVETIQFLRVMVEPIVELPEDMPSKAKDRQRIERELHTQARERLDAHLQNPELDDTFAIIEGVLRREAPHLMALGRRLVKMLPTVAAMAAEGEAREANKTGSSEASQQPST